VEGNVVEEARPRAIDAEGRAAARATFIATFALALASSCATPRAPEPPLLRVATSVHAGSSLSGPRAEAPVELADPWAVEFAVFYADELPRDAGRPLSASVREVLDDRADLVLRARGVLVRDIRRIDGIAEPSTARWTSRHSEALWPGTTAVLDARRNDGLSDAPVGGWERFAIAVSRRERGALEVALELENWAPPPAAGATGDSPGARRATEREQVVLDAPHGGPITLYFPAPAQKSPRGGYVATILASPARVDDPAFATVLEEARTELEASSRAATDRARAFTATDAFRSESAGALNALRAGSERPAILFLAETTGARTAADLALCASAQSLQDCLAFVRERAAGASVPTEDSAAFGWFIERWTLSWLAARAADEEHPLEAELESLLLRRTGELARFPDLIGEVLAECASVAELDERFVRENAIFLADADPAARVRSYDWLASRGAAPAGYDPLASRESRRAALSRAEDLAESAKSGPKPAGGGR
jgi:hypothetical protein